MAGPDEGIRSHFATQLDPALAAALERALATEEGLAAAIADLERLKARAASVSLLLAYLVLLDAERSAPHRRPEALERADGLLQEALRAGHRGPPLSSLRRLVAERRALERAWEQEVSRRFVESPEALAVADLAEMAHRLAARGQAPETVRALLEQALEREA
jgi:hypothetical protein